MCLRNDNYGGDQYSRFECFIRYYGFLCRKYKDLFEFVICDYNSPNEATILELALPWNLLSPLKVVIVNEKTHGKFSYGKGRPILDYLGRNIAVRHASSSFVAILNQDIYISESIASVFHKGLLNKKYFYRADRWDFPFEGLSTMDSALMEQHARQKTNTLHRRHDRNRLPISTQVIPGQENEITSLPLVGEVVDHENCIFQGRPSSWKDRFLQRMTGRVDFEFLGLHTNAGGDFIVASKAAWEKIHGACETTEFYMHLDSYLLAQLYGAGLRQAIFAYPHQVFHADHDRSARLLFREKIPYEVHKKRLCDIALGVSTYRLNSPDWGMKNENLEVIQL
jgi:hypothetical protein